MSGTRGSPIRTTRQRAEEEIVRQEEERKRKLMRMRLDIANSGVRAFEEGRVTDAVKAFNTYLKILEDIKGVREGGLSPKLFDVRRDLTEMILISGVYWDLVKAYDHTSTKERRREFLHYLEKYILFCKGTPYQTLCSETLRKYIAANKPKHTEDFKNAYRAIGGTKCFVATSLLDVVQPATVPRLRAFRSRVLMRKPWGRAFVKWYYGSGPVLAARMNRMPRWIRLSAARVLDLTAWIIQK